MPFSFILFYPKKVDFYLNKQKLRKIKNYDVLIIDDFGRQILSNVTQIILLDLIKNQNQKGATIFCSQLPIKNWHDLLKQKAITDEFVDRIIHSAIGFELKKNQ